MKAQTKSGKVISGKLAEIFVRKGIASEVQGEGEQDKPKRGRKAKTE